MLRSTMHRTTPEIFPIRLTKQAIKTTPLLIPFHARYMLRLRVANVIHRFNNELAEGSPLVK